MRRLPLLGRNLKELLDVLDHIDDLGAGFQSIVYGFDASSAADRLIFQIFGAVAEFECELIREPTIAGLQAARERAVLVGDQRS